MPVEYTVRDGDCISSIAVDYGFFPDTLWNHPKNSELKQKRKDPNILLPGDVVFIPDKTLKEVQKSTDARHTFKRKGVPEILRLRMLDEDGYPRANVPYRLDIDGRLIEGTLNAEGALEVPIPPNARNGLLILGSEGQEQYTLALGHLDPVETAPGLIARLRNLGYNCGWDNTEIGDRTREALFEFQKANQLQETGEPDDATRSKLLELHGC
jgi:hypothetical protein